MLVFRAGLLFSTIFLCALSGCDNDRVETETGESPVGVVDAGSSAGDASRPGPDGGSATGADLPIIFVHGFAGSASQFESQALRFIANGYSKDKIRAFDHDGAGFDTASFLTGVDEYVNAAIKDFGVQKVYLVGHSRGTFVSSMYLGDAARAAKIAKYVSLDGSGCAAAVTAGVPCIEPNQASLPGQKHVEVATSAESFARMYDFFLGKAPTVTQIVKQSGPVEISGRVVNFPANTGRAGTTLDIYEVDSATGARTTAPKVATFSIAADGNWGPATVSPDKHYELAVSAPDTGTQHFYHQRFLRSSHLMRLLSGGSDSPARVNTNASDKHAAITALRMREWTAADVLEVKSTTASGTGQPPVNAITPAAGTPAAGGMGASFLPIGLYIHDDAATPGVSSLALLPYFSTQPFQSGVDIFLPATEPTDGTITLTNFPRGDQSKPQVLNVPNWASSKHSIAVVFADYAQ